MEKKILIILFSVLFLGLSVVSAASISPEKMSENKDLLTITIPKEASKTLYTRWVSPYTKEYPYSDSFQMNLHKNNIKIDIIRDKYYSDGKAMPDNRLKVSITNYYKPVKKYVLHIEKQNLKGTVNSFKRTINNPSAKVEESFIIEGDSTGRIYRFNNDYYNLVKVDAYYDNNPKAKDKIKAPDLTISKINKKGNNYQVTVKNIGTATSKKTTLRLEAYYLYKDKETGYMRDDPSKKYDKKFFIPSLNKGKSIIVKISINKKYRDSTKFFTVDPDNLITEKNKNNNAKTSK
jgi:hypothetical protein